MPEMADGPLGELLNRLKGVRRSNGQYVACCPAHGDRTPSLSVTTGNDGRVLLRCHAGCTLEAICGAIGIKSQELFPRQLREPPQPGDAERSRVIAEHDYTDENGALLSQVVRSEPKAFRQRRPDGRGGWTYSLHGVRRVLYKLPELIEAVALGRQIVIVEGEKSVDRLASLGITATCSSGGARKWRDDYAEPLRGADVVILPDNDAPSRTHAAKVARSLKEVAGRVRIIDLPELPEKGDVYDWLDAGHIIDELHELAESAPEVEVWLSEQQEPGSPNDNEEERESDEWHLLADLVNDPTLTAAPSGVAPPCGYAGRLTLLVGREKQGGKSTTACATVADASKQGVMSLYVTLDEPTADTVQRLVRLGAATDKIAICDRRPANLAATVEQSGAQVIVIDSLANWVEGKVTESGDSFQWMAALGPLRVIAREMNVAVIILAHAKKSGGEYRDSTAIGAAVDLIITQKEQKDKSRKAKVQGRFYAPDFATRMDADGLVTFEYEGQDGAAPAGRRPPPSAGLQKRVLRLLQSAEPEGLKSTSWKDIAKEEGILRTNFFACRRELFTKGYVTFQSGTYRVGTAGARWLETADE